MPTNHKTSLGLNNWAGEDKPKRSDFTEDNDLFDKLLSAHFANTEMHLTEDSRKKLENEVEIGSYFGDGKEQQKITLPFEAKMVIVFMPLRPPVSVEPEKKYLLVNWAFALGEGGSMGAELSANVLMVTQRGEAVESEGAAENMNSAGETYFYAAFR